MGLRRREITLTEQRRSDILAADWNGSDTDARVWLSIAVDGYPRAFVFGVDCSAAAADRPQPPLDDWRMIAFHQPEVGMTSLQAPRPSVPVSIRVDAPPDAMARLPDRADAGGAAEPLVEILIREVRSGLLVQSFNQIWSAARDRDVSFRLAAAKPPAVLVVAASAADWALEASCDGLIDVDAEMEVRLHLPGSQKSSSDRRLFVFDAKPPRVEAPPQLQVVIGRPLKVPVRVMDDPREGFRSEEGVHIPGVSGVERVDWAIDLKGEGKPDAWQPAVALGGGRYEIPIDTKTLPPGHQTPLLVRAVDRVGNSAPPTRVWLETAVRVAKGGIQGKVVLKGRGEPGLSVQIDGPGAPQPVTSAAGGSFEFKELDPGAYTLRASARSETSSTAPSRSP